MPCCCLRLFLAVVASHYLQIITVIIPDNAVSSSSLVGELRFVSSSNRLCSLRFRWPCECWITTLLYNRSDSSPASPGVGSSLRSRPRQPLLLFVLLVLPSSALSTVTAAWWCVQTATLRREAH